MGDQQGSSVRPGVYFKASQATLGLAATLQNSEACCQSPIGGFCRPHMDTFSHAFVAPPFQAKNDLPGDFLSALPSSHFSPLLNGSKKRNPERENSQEVCHTTHPDDLLMSQSEQSPCLANFHKKQENVSSFSQPICLHYNVGE